MRHRTTWLATAGILFAAQFASAQGTSTYGAFGNRTLGGGISSGTASGMTGSAFGSSAAGGMGGMQSQSGSGQVTGSERFLPQNRQNAFVGADSGDAANLRSLTGSQTQGLNALFGPQGMMSQFSRQNQQSSRNQGGGQQNSARSKIRIAVRVDAMEPSETASTPTDTSVQFASRLQNLPAVKSSRQVQVSMRDRTAILSGRVATARERDLIAGLAMMEPGISDVQNDLVVDPAATKAEELPTPSSRPSSVRPTR